MVYFTFGCYSISFNIFVFVINNFNCIFHCRSFEKISPYSEFGWKDFRTVGASGAAGAILNALGFCGVYIIGIVTGFIIGVALSVPEVRELLREIKNYLFGQQERMNDRQLETRSIPEVRELLRDTKYDLFGQQERMNYIQLETSLQAHPLGEKFYIKRSGPNYAYRKI